MDRPSWEKVRREITGLPPFLPIARSMEDGGNPGSSRTDGAPIDEVTEIKAYVVSWGYWNLIVTMEIYRNICKLSPGYPLLS